MDEGQGALLGLGMDTHELMTRRHFVFIGRDEIGQTTFTAVAVAVAGCPYVFGTLSLNVFDIVKSCNYTTNYLLFLLLLAPGLISECTYFIHTTCSCT